MHAKGVAAPPDVREQMVALYLSGASLREAGDALGWSWTAVMSALRAAGIQTRPNHFKNIAAKVQAAKVEDPSVKLCSYCEHRKPATTEFFYLGPKGRLRSRCKVCHQLINNLSPRTEKTRVRHRTEEQNRRLRTKYGVSREEYEVLVASSGGYCRICGKPESHRNHRRLSLDHNHVTKKVRGLLCSKCNTILGMANDDPNILRAATQYLLGTLPVFTTQVPAVTAVEAVTTGTAP